MATQDPANHAYHASAFGIAGQIDRPVPQTIPSQAAISLAPGGKQSIHRVDNYSLPGMVSCSAAQTHLGGSMDQTHGVYTTYSCSVVEDLNICDVVTADKVVSRLTVYHPIAKEISPGSKGPQPLFSITGSYFEGLRIAGQKIDVKLATKDFHDSTYESFCQYGTAPPPNPNAKWLIGNNINRHELQGQRELLGHNYDIVDALAERYEQWDPNQQQPTGGHTYRCSPANLLNLGDDSELLNFGCMICVPRFGVVCLAELLIYHCHRYLTMVRVQMCSPGEGSINGGGTGGGASGSIPPG